MSSSDQFKVFIGSEYKTKIPAQTLIWSIRKYAPTVDIEVMLGPKWEYSTEGIRQGTGFSLRRWMIPQACGYEGLALYLDADMLSLYDVRFLRDDFLIASAAASGAPVGCTFQPDRHSKTPRYHTSVMVIDCARVEGLPEFQIDQVLEKLRRREKEGTGKKAYADLMHAERLARLGRVCEVDRKWNAMDPGRVGGAFLLHYTNEARQPWYDPKHPCARVWEEAFRDACQCGAVKRADVQEALDLFTAPRLDKRKQQGLHPHYMRYVKECPR